MTRTLVSFTLDNLGDAADLYRGSITAPRPPGTNYALEIGVPALLDLFARCQIPLTYFVEGWSAERYPTLVQDFVKRGIEVGMHGWQHEIWHLLNAQEVDTLVKRAHASLSKAMGKAPQAFRAPGGKTTAATQQLLAQLGYTIDASYQEPAQPSRAQAKLVNVPYLWHGVDATHWLWHKRTPEETLQHWRAAIEHAIAHQAPMVFIFHSHVMGMQHDRLAVGELLIRHVQADPRLQIVPLATIGASVA
jgi:peptidoglycan/xylan/chitin deacetylase (PgdA/CDA1 family)